ncbi:ROK family transcriptional regulator [Thiofilum flexile]|uniref:ROK family transcriptional regulator n=1 Tax=Thiofilum flexile TaxID=125627 RepID=UPI00037968DD|nr:ROK family transcriptional regulator [Thiofilum flexile]
MSKQIKNRDQGCNLIGVGQYNERLVLQLIRRTGSLPKAEIARRTALSAQTVSVIIRRLMNEGLLSEQERQREKGKLGQPVIPITLNPEGAYSIGIKIGRRSLDTILIDFTGAILKRLSLPYLYPDPSVIFPQINQDIQALMRFLKPEQRTRLLGIGVAAPYNLGGWQSEAHIPPEITQQWHDIDIKERIQTKQTLPVWSVNDATAACITSLECRGGAPFNNYLYIFLGTFVGGGVVLNRSLFLGSHNNSGAIGSMPLPTGLFKTPSTAPAQLINCASLYLLDEALQAQGQNPENVFQQLAELPAAKIPPELYHIFQQWLDQAAMCLAYTIASAVSVIDFEGVVIDGLLPAPLIEQVKTKVEQALKQIDSEGLAQPHIIAGVIGAEARALGGALVPFYVNFAPDREVLLRTERETISLA